MPLTRTMHQLLPMPGLRAIAATSLLLLAGPGLAVADELTLTPSVSVQSEFNDNVLFSTISRTSDFVTTVSPRLTLSEASERLNASLSGGINWLTYGKTEGLTATDFLVQGQVGYRASALTDIGLTGAYVQNSRPDTVNQLTDLSAGAGSDQRNYALRIGHKVNPLTAGTLSYAFGTETYENPRLQDIEVHTTGLAVTRDLANLVKGVISAGYSHTVYRTSNSDDYSFSTGLSWQPSERIALSGSVGGRLTQSQFSLADGSEGSNDNWGIIGSLTATYAGELSRSSLSFVRDFAAGSGLSGATERTQVGVTLDRRVTENLSAQLMVRYTLNNASFTAQESKDVALRGSAGVSYEINKNLSVGCNYSYYRIEYRPSNQQAVQNTYLVQAQWRYPSDKL